MILHVHNSLAICMWTSHVAGIHLHYFLVLLMLSEVYHSFGLPSATMNCDTFLRNVTEWWFFCYLDCFYDIDGVILLFQRFYILPCPCWWSDLFIPTWLWPLLSPSRYGDHLYHDPILYVNINRHGWLAIWVVLWPMASKTWTMYMYSGLGTDNTFVATVTYSWHNILWSMYVIGCESHIVLFMTLQ